MRGGRASRVMNVGTPVWRWLVRRGGPGAFGLEGTKKVVRAGGVQGGAESAVMVVDWRVADGAEERVQFHARVAAHRPAVKADWVPCPFLTVDSGYSVVHDLGSGDTIATTAEVLVLVQHGHK